MLGHEPFFHDLIRKQTVCFAALFNDLRIQRFEEDGTVSQDLRVPLKYAPKEKVVALLKGDPNLTKQAAVTLPVLSFQLVRAGRDNQRMINPVQNIARHVPNTTGVTSVHVPIPWNFFFDLHVYFGNMSDGMKIVEQILPFFASNFSVNANLVPDLGAAGNHDLYIEMGGEPDLTDSFDSAPTDRRYLIWTIRFVLRGYLYGPLRKSAIIKFVDVGLYSPTSNTLMEGVGSSPMIDRVTVNAGLTANGQPTSNAEIAVPWNQVEPYDDYGFVTYIAGHLEANT
jgi:hypothetical protein